jgi:hypothetical protein
MQEACARVQRKKFMTSIRAALHGSRSTKFGGVGSDLRAFRSYFTCVS